MVRFNIECDLPFSRQDFWRLRASPYFLDFIVSDGLLKKMEATPVVEQPDGWSTRKQHYCPAKVDCPDFIRAVIGDTMFEVDDYQTWHDRQAPFQLDFNIKPSFLANLSKTSGTLRVDDKDTTTDSEDDIETFMLDAIDAGESADTLSAEDSATDPDGSESTDSSDTSDSESPSPASSLDSLPLSERCVHVVSGETRVSILTVGWFIEKAIVHNLRNFYKEYPNTVMRFRQKLYAEFAAGDESVNCGMVIDRLLEKEEKDRQRKVKSERAREWAKDEELDEQLSLEEADDDWDDVE